MRLYKTGLRAGERSKFCKGSRNEEACENPKEDGRAEKSQSRGAGDMDPPH